MATEVKPLEICEDAHEDGEITDDDEEPPMEIPANVPNPPVNYPSSDDEQAPEDVIKAYAEKQKQLAEQEHPEIVVDPKLCRICVKNEHKYRCPRCDVRTCSLDCSKKHKADNECDGVRQPFSKVEKLSQYDSQKSIDDQKFMHQVKEKAGLGGKSEEFHQQNQEIDGQKNEMVQEVDPNALRYTQSESNSQERNRAERYLLNACRSRHVWLGFTDAAENGSRHEPHSDTVFWNLHLKFIKQGATPEDVISWERTVPNMPESVRLVTVLKQFFKPRQYGFIVSESDLDLEKLKPFIERGIENVNVYMEVHGKPEKFYGVIANETILQNLRNRVVADHPKFVITLKDEFVQKMELVSQEDLEELKEKYEKVGAGGGARGGFGGFGGGGGGGRGGRGRGGFHRGGGHHGGNGGGGGGGQNNFRKRPHQDGGYQQHNGFNKRGRGNFQNRRGGGGYRQNHQNADAFDPFEPFAGPVRLPMEYNS